MAPKRRPAAAPKILARPAARVRERVVWAQLKELNSAMLPSLEHLLIRKAKYYGREVDFVGKVISLKYEGGESYAEVRVTGTQDDELLRVVSGLPDRIVSVHLCLDGCPGTITGEALVHGAQYRQVDKAKEPWYSNVEAVGVPERGPDELARLREEAERAAERERSAKSPKRKKEKDKKDKKRKREKKVKDEGKKEGKKKKKKVEESSYSSESETEEVIGQKDPVTLFKGTGLDPVRRRRKKISKRARRLGKASSSKEKKKKESKEEDGSEDSSSSSTPIIEEESGFFQGDRKVKLIASQCPGSLTFAAMLEAREHLLTQSGTAWSMDKNQLSPLFVHFTRQGMGHHMPPAMLQEAVTIATVLDSLLLGRAAAACDMLSQRLKALECLSRGAHWSVSRRLELVRTDGMQLSQDAETLEAARLAREEMKLKALTQGPAAPKGDSGYDNRNKGKTKGGKGAPKGRGEDGQKGKGNDGRKEDRGGWQNKEKK